MPTGNKYQATIKSVKSKLIDDFDNWSAEEKIKFGLVKETFLKRIFSGELLNKSEEKLPDKEHLRKALVENPKAAPSKAKLVQRVSLTYNLRKRLKTGI